MMLHVHKDRTDALTLLDVANDFVGEKENRKQLLGKFSRDDIPNKFSISSKSTQTKIRDKTRGIVHNCGDLTCTNPPPSHFLLATGLINNLAKNQVSAVFHSRVIRRSVPPKFMELCMKTPYLCPRRDTNMAAVK